MKTEQKMTYALTVAGFDGSAGAGVLADIKTMAYFGVYAQAVCSAITIQNESEFFASDWVKYERMEAQLEALAKVRNFSAIKIGLIENISVLKKIVRKLRDLFPDAFVLWDPIVASSSGFQFWSASDIEELKDLLPAFDLITPNQNEFSYLGLGLADSRGEIRIGKDFALLLKGGHSVSEDCVDILFYQGNRLRYKSARILGQGKHGTGCALSSAILACIALGNSLPEACTEAKKYMNQFLSSGEALLAFVNHE